MCATRGEDGHEASLIHGCGAPPKAFELRFGELEGSDAELIEDGDGDGMRSARLGNLAPYM